MSTPESSYTPGPEDTSTTRPAARVAHEETFPTHRAPKRFNRRTGLLGALAGAVIAAVIVGPLFFGLGFVVGHHGDGGRADRMGQHQPYSRDGQRDGGPVAQGNQGNSGTQRGNSGDAGVSRGDAQQGPGRMTGPGAQADANGQATQPSAAPQAPSTQPSGVPQAPTTGSGAANS